MRKSMNSKPFTFSHLQNKKREMLLHFKKVVNEGGGCGYFHIFRLRKKDFNTVVNEEGGCEYFHIFRLKNEKVHL